MPQLPMNQPQNIDHREREARANDIVSVYNPLDQDYFVGWDSRFFTVKAKSSTELPRYIAANYLEQMINKILMTEADQRVLSENKDRVEKRKQKTMDAKEEEQFARMLMPDMQTSRQEELRHVLFQGVVRRYGDGLPPELSQAQAREARPDAMDWMLSMDEPYVPEPLPESPTDEAMREVSA